MESMKDNGRLGDRKWRCELFLLSMFGRSMIGSEVQMRLQHGDLPYRQRAPVQWIACCWANTKSFTHHHKELRALSSFIIIR
jgi:hypothetical protein